MNEIYNPDNGEKLLTIAIPTYNGAATIKNLLEILLPQYDPRVEILISDNCSTDNTPQIINEYIKRYPFIRYIRNESNMGADCNFLQCMRLATGRFTLLVSDDDIIVENAVGKILDFLSENPDLSLAYLEAVGFKDKYIDWKHCHRYKEFSPAMKKSIVTTDKRQFMHYAQRLWGFTSTYIWSTVRFSQIENPEQYIGTYFMQSYIHILCSNRQDDRLGLIAGPCIAVGEYGIIGNYDTALVEGIYYKRMLKFAIENGYDKKQLCRYYIWKICFLGRIAVIKERVAGVRKTKISNLIKCSWYSPRAWISLYPVIILPKFICRMIFVSYRRLHKRDCITYVNRPT